MATIIVIPARYGSTRLPGKMLLAETGWPLIRHTYEQARKIKNVQSVVVATDDERIKEAVQDFGGMAVMTSPACKSGTDRVAEVATKGWYAPNDVFVNLQGDEPEVDPGAVEKLVNVLDDTHVRMATLAVPISQAVDFESSNDSDTVKVVNDKNCDALYFSRAAIPFSRVELRSAYKQHLGVYAYRKMTLAWFSSLTPCYLEEVEGLEQLRVLYNGMKIRVEVVDGGHKGVDTREDYAAFVARWQQTQR